MLGGIIWIIVVGFVAGIIARMLSPGPNNPSGFIFTTVIGIAGALIASYLGRALGWYGPGEAAGFIMSVVGAVLLLAIYRAVAKRRPA